ncbi:MAG: hypothetical protein HYV09_02690 [Deltaproteobacteria bacterium]|nr:hypothetical protein [Deltaproteobacteria bacterium]
MRARQGWVWLGLFVTGCSTRGAESLDGRARTETSPSGVAATAQRSAADAPAIGARGRAVLQRLDAFPALSNRLGRGVTLAHDARGFGFDRSTSPTKIVAAGGSVLTGFVPLRADGAVHVARGDRPGVSLDVTTALRPVAGERADGAVIYPDAALDEHVLQVMDGIRIEELRVLESPRAASAFSWTLRPGPAVSTVRLRDERVEVLEGTEVRLISEPVVAFDAKDQRRHAQLTLTKIDDHYRLEATLDTHDLTYPVVLDPGWTRTFNKMSSTRLHTNAIPLSGGKVAVFPGWLSSLTVDIYDPVTNTFSAGPPAKTARFNGGAVRLAGGDQVVLYGGFYGPSTTWEIWDPITGSTTPETLANGIDGVMSVVLGSGKIFAMRNGSNFAALYDPPTKTWTALPTMVNSHGGGAAVLLKSGKVLITGGCCNTATSELYDPSLNTFAPTAGMQGARSGHSMTLLPSGKVLVAGSDSSGTVQAELFDPTTATFSKVTDVPGSITDSHRAITLPDASVLLVNVDTTGTVLRYTEGTGWATEAKLTMRRNDPALALLPGGRVLAAGGEFGKVGIDESSNTAEVWGPPPKTCTSSTGCASGFCVDGYCCDRACGEQCYACDVAGREGFCSPVDGAPPHGTRTVCSPYLNCTNGKCVSGCATAGDCATGMGCLYGTCATKLDKGAACVSGTDCASGFCIDGTCCDGACTDQCKACDNAGSLGTCSDTAGAPHGTRTSCAPYTCGGGACLTGCTSDAQCLAGNRCDSAGTCVPTLANGKGCTRASECASGFCVDGYCCNAACDTACRTCAKAGALGTCSLVAAGTADPRKLCTGECASGCGTTGCTYRANTTPCGQSCIGYQLTSGGRCSGTSEACTGASTLACAGGLVCADGKTCKTACATGADCVSGFCEGGACVSAPADAGAPEASVEAGADAGADAAAGDASSPDTAAGGDTAPADAPATGYDATADAPAPPIEATPKLPATVLTCTKGTDCTTGFCVEGVCCDSPCTDRCHSCALLSNPGKCTVEPIGVDLKQECGPAYTCLGTCNGSGECIGAGAGTLCARNRCTGPSTGVGPAYCAAPGAKCNADEGVPFDCSPYACAPAFGACMQACVGSMDCANGFVCDTTTKTCVAPAIEEDGGGCALAPAGRGRSTAVALLLGAIVLAARRRRRD